jgi:tetratricopeptide (TPR) repeat protein
MTQTDRLRLCASSSTFIAGKTGLGLHDMTKAKNIDEYIEQQRRALSGNPECGTTHYNLGVALMGKRQDSEAERAFLAAIDCSPSLAEAYVQLGALCLKRGDLDGCLDWNKRAVKARPGFSEGYGNIGFVHMQRGEADEAIEALKKATIFNFRFIQGFVTLATAYLMKGEVDNAIEACLNALKAEPNFPVAHNNLAIAYLEKGDRERAKTHLQRAVALGYEVVPELIKELGV